MMEALSSPETSVLTTATWRNFPEDAILKIQVMIVPSKSFTMYHFRLSDCQVLYITNEWRYLKMGYRFRNIRSTSSSSVQRLDAYHSVRTLLHEICSSTKTMASRLGIPPGAWVSAFIFFLCRPVEVAALQYSSSPCAECYQIQKVLF
jgi:hypothetical protein